MLYDDHDVLIAAKTIFGEARNQSIEGQVAIMWVIRHRAERRYGGEVGSVAKACLAPLQFSCWDKDDPNRALLDRMGPEKLSQQISLATGVLSGITADPTDGADHYFTIVAPIWAERWPPDWAETMRHMVDIGDHTFYNSQLKPA
jgi:spore germination cell wall hydrolase CwlJ-like protein